MCSVHLHTGITVEQKGANLSASFNAHCLVVSQKFATLHTHTHTHTHTMFAPIVREEESAKLNFPGYINNKTKF